MSEPLYYTVWLHATETVVAFGPVEQCARMLGMTTDTFYSTISRINSGYNKKYEYYAEPLYLEEYAGEFDDDGTVFGEESD